MRVKSWYQSKTILGGLAVVAAMLLRNLIPGVTEGDVLHVLTLVAEAVGAVVAIFGRVVADTRILGRW